MSTVRRHRTSRSGWKALCPARKGKHNALYSAFADWAETIKIALQMLIGVLIMGTLVAKLISRGLWLFSGGPQSGFLNHHGVLWIVGKGLAYSAGIELAYMLFTPGPDEAVEPVILGIASATLLVASGELNWEGAVIVPALVIAMAIGFWIKSRFIPKAKDGGGQTPSP